MQKTSFVFSILMEILYVIRPCRFMIKYLTGHLFTGSGGYLSLSF